MPDLNVAILGCGRMGKERARCSSAVGAKITAVYDPDTERSAVMAAQYGAAALLSEQEIPWHSLDAVFFCTPPNCRESQALPAIHAGVAFMAEKPVGLSRLAAAQVGDALKRSPVVNAIGYMNRCRASVQHARSVLAGTRLLGLSGYWVCRPYTVPWWLDSAASGGPLNEQATHLFDLYRFLGGEITALNTIPTDPTASAEQSLGSASVLQFRSGALGTLFYSCESNGKTLGLHLFTDCGSIEFSGWDFRMTANTIDGTFPEVETEDVFLLETEQFLEAVRSHSLRGVGCDWEDALLTQSVVDTARTSLNEHRTNTAVFADGR
ncbi:MAG: Gfo/Idh/MocA family protein [Janthinobacterium lividum]